MRLLFFCFLCGLSLQTSFAQDSLDEKMKWYALAKQSPNLFVHFDKNVYSNNETVYFTGYIIKAGRVPIASHKMMSVVLIRDIDSSLIIDDKFIMTNGLSLGSLTLPDSIPTGNYRFLVYTDKLVDKIPELLFTQNITIKSSIEPSFKATIKLLAPVNNEINVHKVLVSTSAPDDRFLAKPAQINYRYGKVSKSTATDASGQSIITLATQTELTDPNLYVKLKYGSDSTFINMGLPQPKNKAIVKFYPEGGSLVSGLSSKVAWEVKDQQNQPVALKAFLFKNQEVIDTIETSSYGIGKFMLKPQIGTTYTVKLIHSNLADSTYYLPKATDEGLTLMLQNAIAEDTLRINLKSTKKQSLTLLVHNFKESFLNFPFQLKNENSLLKLPLNTIPKGLTTLTVLDSLNRPLVERIFFAHYSAAEKITINTDQSIYKQREKVTLKLNLKLDDNAVVSIAAVQNNRLSLQKTNDIESYTYLTNELSSLPISSSGIAYKDRNYLEQVLLVKGWRRYTWQGLNAITAADTASIVDTLKISGQVSKQKKEVKDSLIIGTMGGNGVSLINTSANGFFSLGEDQLITPPGKKLYVFVSGAKKLPYFTRISINDEFFILNQKLSKVVHHQQTNLPSNLTNNIELLLKNNEKSIRLKEVVITNKQDNGFMHTKGLGPNACGDYVCRFNILNCPNHGGDSENRQPVKGRSYNSGGGKITYAGCSTISDADQNLFTLVKGIHLEKEFYQNDYKDPNEPAFFSTIYWNYSTLLNSKKATELSFYTSDITGKFRIVVQGVSNKDVVYAEHFFEVISKASGSIR